LKVDNDEKFTVEGKAFHTFRPTTLPMKKLCRTVFVQSWFIQQVKLQTCQTRT